MQPLLCTAKLHKTYVTYLALNESFNTMVAQKYFCIYKSNLQSWNTKISTASFTVRTVSINRIYSTKVCYCQNSAMQEIKIQKQSFRDGSKQPSEELDLKVILVLRNNSFKASTEQVFSQFYLRLTQYRPQYQLLLRNL